MHINGIGYLLLFKDAHILQYWDRTIIVQIVYFGKACYVKKKRYSKEWYYEIQHIAFIKHFRSF